MNPLARKLVQQVKVFVAQAWGHEYKSPIVEQKARDAFANACGSTAVGDRQTD